MKSRANYIIIAATVLCAGSAIWLDWQAVALTSIAYGLHKARPLALDWFG